MSASRLLVLLALLMLPLTLFSFKGSRTYSPKSATHPHAPHMKIHRAPSTHPRAPACSTCVRDKKGHIRRSPHAREEFVKSHPCPATGRTSGACPGYVVDHVVALKRGGIDEPANMQWQTKAAAKAKDKAE